MAITCNGPTQHFKSGCALLLHYDADGDGFISDVEYGHAYDDYMNDIISPWEAVFVGKARDTAGGIDELCPGCGTEEDTSVVKFSNDIDRLVCLTLDNSPYEILPHNSISFDLPIGSSHPWSAGICWNASTSGPYVVSDTIYHDDFAFSKSEGCGYVQVSREVSCESVSFDLYATTGANASDIYILIDGAVKYTIPKNTVVNGARIVLDVNTRGNLMVETEDQSAGCNDHSHNIDVNVTNFVMNNATAFNSPNGVVVAPTAPGDVLNVSVPITVIEGDAVTCDDPTPSGYDSGCDLLLHYDTNNDGIIDDNEESNAVLDRIGGLITAEETDFVIDTNNAGSINAHCPGCYSNGGEAIFSVTEFVVLPHSCVAPCDISIHIKWKNVGTASGVLTPGYTFEGDLKTSVPITLGPEMSTVRDYMEYNVAHGSYEVCPVPNT